MQPPFSLPLTRSELLDLNLELDENFARDDYPKEETDTVYRATRDSKWKRGRTHDALHFGAKSMGPYASSLRVAAIPSKILKVSDHLHEPNPDVATLVYYRKGAYGPPMRLSGLETDFEDGFTWICCLRGCTELVLNVPAGATQKDKEGEFREEMTESVFLEEGNAWRYHDLASSLAVNKCKEDARLLTIRLLSAEARERLQLRDSRFRRSRMQQEPLPLPPKCVTVELKHHVGGSALEVPALEAEHVRAVYNTIASHWDHTRHKAWPKVVDFLHSLPNQAIVADIGCGNGKYLRCRKRSAGRTVGIDTCIPLLRKAQRERQVDKTNRSEVCAGDAVALPIRDEFFDAAIVIAVLHHLSTVDRRIAAVREAARLVRNGGRVLLYGWAREQGPESRRTFPSSDILVPWHLSDHMVELEGGIPEPGSENVRSSSLPTHGERVDAKNSTIFSRYCHVFVKGEIEGLVKAAGGCLRLCHAYYDCSNWCAIAEKCPMEGTHQTAPQ